MQRCPPDATFVDLLDGKLLEAHSDALEDHVDECADCRRLLSELARATQEPSRSRSSSTPDTNPAGSPPPVLPGMRVDRYLIREKIGKGGFGEVFEAYDEKLKRRVALKLLPRSDLEIDPEGTRLREAELAAQLNHTNVVTLHDFGSQGPYAFAVMEFVEGQTLRQWLESSHSLRDTLRIFAEAGAGLSAAHRAGVVHRDFKPENVLVGDDGRVRVADFGLARFVGAPDTDSGTGCSAPEPSSPRQLSGTPLYMSPEQHLGEPADPRSDQFSFAVTLAEAVLGHHPFEGRTREELRAEVQKGWTAPVGSPLPTSIAAALRRALRPDPADRFATLDDLLETLELRKGRGSVWILAGLAATGVTVGALAMDRNEQVDPIRCEGLPAALDDVWNEDVRTLLEGRFSSVEHPERDRITAELRESLDRYTQDWRVSLDETCQSRGRVDASPELLDLRSDCLHRQLGQLNALLEAWTTRDLSHKAIDTALTAVARLGPISACAEVGRLRASDPVPSNERDGVTRVHEQLSASQAAAATGQYDHSRELAHQALELSRTLGHRPTRSEAAFGAALADWRGGAREEALSGYEDAFSEALAGNAPYAAARSASALAVAAANRGKPDDASRWIERAFASLERLEADHARAEVLAAAGMIAVRRQDWEDAGKVFEEAKGIFVESFGPFHPEVGRMANMLANVALKRQEHDRAEALYLEAMAVSSQLFGPGHPRVANILNGLGALHHARGKLAQAHEELERSLSIFTATRGPASRGALSVLQNLALVELDDGRVAEACTKLEAVVVGQRSLEGDVHPQVANALHDLASCQLARGELARAQAGLLEALAITEKTGGVDHATNIDHLVALGDVAKTRGDCGAARSRYDQAAALIVKLFGDDHPRLEATKAAAACGAHAAPP